MDDVISQGRDREPGPGRRRVIAAGLVVAVAVAITVVNWPRHAHARPHPAPSVVTDGPDGITGPTAAWAASLRLPVTGQQPALLSPATGRRQLIGGLPRSGGGYVFTVLGSGWAIQPAAGGAPRAVCDDCAGVPQPVYFLPQRGGSAAAVAVADAVAPAASPRAMWLTSYPRGVSLQLAAGTARQVGVTGRALGPAVRLPVGYLIVRGTASGLLLAPATTLAGAGDEVWDPASRQVSIRGGPREVIAASAGAVALAPPCAAACGVTILSVTAGGHPVRVRLPVGSSVANAAFSPDGSYLALQVSAGAGGDDGGLATELLVAAAGTGQLTAVPQTSLSSDALIGFGWPPGGDRLVAELTFTTKVQLAAWSPGAPRIAVAALRGAVPDVVVG